MGKAKLAFKRALVQELHARAPHLPSNYLHTQVGYALNRWTPRRVQDAISHSGGADPTAGMLALLRDAPKILRLKRAA